VNLTLREWKYLNELAFIASLGGRILIYQQRLGNLKGPPHSHTPDKTEVQAGGISFCGQGDHCQRCNTNQNGGLLEKHLTGKRDGYSMYKSDKETKSKGRPNKKQGGKHQSQMF